MGLKDRVIERLEQLKNLMGYLPPEEIAHEHQKIDDLILRVRRADIMETVVTRQRRKS